MLVDKKHEGALPVLNQQEIEHSLSILNHQRQVVRAHRRTLLPLRSVIKVLTHEKSTYFRLAKDLENAAKSSKKEDVMTESRHPCPGIEDLLYPFLLLRSTSGHVVPLRSLHATCIWIEDGSRKLLQSPFASTPQSFKLHSAGNIGSSTFQDLLCSLPLLESFSANLIHENHVIWDHRPWVCLRLVRCRIGVWTNPTIPTPTSTEKVYENSSAAYTGTTTDGSAEGAEPWPMFKRLGTLTRMEHFTLAETIESPFVSGQGCDLKFGLKHGLDRLKGWRQLRTLDVTGTNQELTEADAWWMREHWPRLRAVEGKITPLPQMHYASCCILEDICDKKDRFVFRGVSLF